MQCVMHSAGVLDLQAQQLLSSAVPAQIASHLSSAVVPFLSRKMKIEMSDAVSGHLSSATLYSSHIVRLLHTLSGHVQDVWT